MIDIGRPWALAAKLALKRSSLEPLKTARKGT